MVIRRLPLLIRETERDSEVNVFGTFHNQVLQEDGSVDKLTFFTVDILTDYTGRINTIINDCVSECEDIILGGAKEADIFLRHPPPGN